MGKEIERKFLVDKAKLSKLIKNMPADSGNIIMQGYLPSNSNTIVRIRLGGDSAYLTIKGENTGATRKEFEYPIPVEDARDIINTLCRRPFIEKIRHKIKYSNHLWEVDIFAGDNEGLIVAEIELQTENENFDIPEWVTEEVTDDSRYYNSRLVSHPFKNW